jgi:hypothetical protein
MVTVTVADRDRHMACRGPGAAFAGARAGGRGPGPASPGRHGTVPSDTVISAGTNAGDSDSDSDSESVRRRHGGGRPGGPEPGAAQAQPGRLDAGPRLLTVTRAGPGRRRGGGNPRLSHWLNFSVGMQLEYSDPGQRTKSAPSDSPVEDFPASPAAAPGGPAAPGGAGAVPSQTVCLAPLHIHNAGDIIIDRNAGF